MYKELFDLLLTFLIGFVSLLDLLVYTVLICAAYTILLEIARSYRFDINSSLSVDWANDPVTVSILKMLTIKLGERLPIYPEPAGSYGAACGPADITSRTRSFDPVEEL